MMDVRGDTGTNGTNGRHRKILDVGGILLIAVNILLLSYLSKKGASLFNIMCALFRNPPTAANGHQWGGEGP